ncbi:MAG: ribosomal RNA small subunit methyltransferase A [Acidobacteria bacterium]|nr:ribosomal RNA small subunit methyltransferase A [Acidobacteriota bacterium]
MEEPQLRLKAKKHFGQHFLVAPDAIRRISEAALALPAEGIIEIGPGGGVLTTPLLEDGRPLFAVELDPEAAGLLRVRFGGLPHFHLLEGDAVRIPFPKGGPWSVVGNLPYNAATAILTRFLVEPIPWSGMVFMFQLEVGRKLTGTPGQKDYGPLSVLVQLCARVERVIKLGPGAFLPRPKVDSIVLAFHPDPDGPAHSERKPLLEFLHLCFAHRRKTLANNLAARFPGARAQAACEAAGIHAGIRAEGLGPRDLLTLFRGLNTPGG